MGISLPKAKIGGLSIKAPKLSAPSKNFVSKPNIGYAKQYKANVIGTKVKLK